MKKKEKRHGLLSLNNSCFCGSLFLLLLVTACKSNQIMIDSNEVKSVHFWFVNPTDLYNVSYEFLNDALYKPLTPDDWIPSYMKEYLKDHPEERDKVLSPVP